MNAMNVSMYFELSRLYAAEAERYVKRDRVTGRIVNVADPSERQRLSSLSDTFENVALALVKWREACSAMKR